MDSFKEIANKPALWIACIPMVLIICYQAYSFMKKAFKTGLEMGMSRDTLKIAIRSGAISAVGPSCAIGVGVVALMAIIGGPFGFLKLADCGSLIYELTNVNLISEALGTTSDALSKFNWVDLIWTMAASCVFWFVTVAFMTPSYDKILQKVIKKDENVLNYVVMACTIGIYCKNAVPHLIKISPATYAVLASAAVMLVLVVIKNKLKLKWLNEWSLPISMIFGMAASVVF